MATKTATKAKSKLPSVSAKKSELPANDVTPAQQVSGGEAAPTQAAAPQAPDTRRSYRLVVPQDGVQRDFDRYVTVSTGYEYDKLTDAALLCKSQLKRNLQLFKNYDKAITVDFFVGYEHTLSVVFDFKHQDLYLKCVKTNGGEHEYTAILMTGVLNQSTIDLPDVDPVWFRFAVDKPVKMVLVHYFNRLTEFLGSMYTELSEAEQRLTTFAQAVADTREQVAAEQAAQQATPTA